MNPPPHSVGNGQHPADHTRPFFYVQPSQPYFPYQWHMQNPYNPYMGFPGSGYNYGQFPKKKAKKGSCDETKCVSHHDAQEQSHPDVVKECYEECATMLKPDACKGPEKKNVTKQIQTEIPWKENMVATDKGSWDRSGARPRNFNNPWKSYPQPRNTEQERCHWKKVPRRPGVYQRPWRDERDETYEGEFPRPHRERGYSKRRGTRY
ncbi:hypothetical protein AOXY_G4206 [Acipenser oxyrinchus oxyrinchus]|uniref:Uncharacterized protein n=1 Tax=Acipenser oxyrinchus oxyrinchus TaxID=40147 RepID=A0AAD8GGR1_ACIOX|nr:hypothetical protein AOXY_G4206 [Acipenser oxyrinchus oxyrinchus]